MTLLEKDLSICTLEEALKAQAENWAWSRDLRRKTSSLVNSRLAQDISYADYQTNRLLVREDAAECRRQRNILDARFSQIGTALWKPRD